MEKRCEGCGKIIKRRDCDNNYRWNRRKFCTKKCANTLHNLNNDDICLMWSFGVKISAIGAIYGVSGATIRERIEREGFSSNRALKESLKIEILGNSKKSVGGCWEWLGGINRGGYGIMQAGMSIGFTLAHRISYYVFNGDFPRGLDVCHKCDNRKCVNPGHLFVGTRKDNMRDAQDKNRIAKGKLLPHTKLTKESVLEIKDLLSKKETAKNIAKKFGVSSSCISAVAQGRNWAWVSSV